MSCATRLPRAQAGESAQDCVDGRFTFWSFFLSSSHIAMTPPQHSPANRGHAAFLAFGGRFAPAFFTAPTTAASGSEKHSGSALRRGAPFKEAQPVARLF